jgi:hypothetical protein
MRLPFGIERCGSCSSQGGPSDPVTSGSGPTTGRLSRFTDGTRAAPPVSDEVWDTPVAERSTEVSPLSRPECHKKMTRTTAMTTTTTTMEPKPKAGLRELGGADLASARVWGGRTPLASGGVWTIVPPAPRIGSKDLHFVHLMCFPIWTASAWYDSPHCGHVISIMFAAPHASDRIVSYFGIVKRGWS